MSTHPAVRVASLTTRGLGWVLAMFLGIVIALFVVVGVASATFGDLESSTWQIAGAGAFKYFPMAMGIMLTPAFLPVYVAQGITRRYVAVGSAVFIAIWAAALTGVMAVGYGVETAVYNAAGLEQRFDDTPHLFGSWSDVHLIFTEYFLLIAIHMIVGWLIGTTYYVLGWFLATLLLPISLIPMAMVEGLLTTSWIGAGLEEFTSYTRPALVIAIPASLLVIAATWVVNYALTRSLPIKLKSA